MMDLTVGLTILVVFFIALYFILIKPQVDQLNEHRKLVANLKKGDYVVTAGGIVGFVVDIPDKEHVTLEIAEGVRVRVKSDLVYEHEEAIRPSDDLS